MARMSPLDPNDVPDLAPAFEIVSRRMGFIPNALLTMARKPKVVSAFIALGAAINDPDSTLPADLRGCIGHIASRTAGCLYCAAHTASTTVRNTRAADKVAAVWEFETSPLFDDAERAALRFAQCAASVPNAVTDADFAALRRHFDEEQIVEIMAIVSYFGFLNRWNDSMATTLEDEPTAVAGETLAASGWHPGKHAAETA